MNKLKITSLMLVTAFMFTLLFTGQTEARFFSDEQVESIVVSLGFMQNRANGEFDPDDPVSRAEFAVYLYALLGRPPVTELRFFRDVAPDDGQFNEINTIAAFRLMNGTGDEMFSPDATIRLEHAIRSLVLLAGYGSRAYFLGGYPIGNLRVANELGLLNGINLPMYANVDRRTMARLIYNVMNVEIWEMVQAGTHTVYDAQGNTVLSVNSSIYRAEGVVTATDLTGLYMASGAAREGFIMINDLELEVGFTHAANYLGYHVVVYYRQVTASSVPVILAITPTNRNNIIEIDTNDLNTVASFADGVYTIETDGRTRRVTIPPTASLIFNNVAYPGVPGDHIYLPDNGRVTIISNTGNANAINVVKVESYRTYFVDRVNTFDLTITDRYLQPDVTLLGADISYRILLRGEEVPISSIRENMVLMIYADREIVVDGLTVIDNEASTVFTVIICTDSVTGTVEMVDSEGGIYINGERFRKSAEFLAATRATGAGSAEAINPGITATFYLDNNRLIAGTLFRTTDSGGYGFLVGLGQIAGSFLTRAEIRIFTSNGDMAVYELSGRMRFNGEMVEFENAVNAIHASAPIHQLIHYEARAGRITVLNTAEVSTGPLVNYTDRFTLDDMFLRPYNHNNVLGSLYRVTTQTVVFSIPVDDFGNVQMADEDLFLVSNSLAEGQRGSALRNPDYVPGAGLPFYLPSLYVYDISPFNLSIGAIVLLDASGAGGGTVHNTQDIMIVDDVIRTLNDNDEETVMIHGFVWGERVEVMARNIGIRMFIPRADISNIWRQNNPMVGDFIIYARDLQRGDIIQFSTDALGNMTALRVLAHNFANMTQGYEGINSGQLNELDIGSSLENHGAARVYFHESYFATGVALSVLSNVVLTFVENPRVVTGGTPETPTWHSAPRVRAFFAMPMTVVYVVDTVTNTVTVGDFNNIASGDFMAVHIRGGNVRTIVVVKR